MKVFAILLAFTPLFLACARPPDSPPAKAAQDTQREQQQYNKELDEIRKNIRGDLKIKLKRDGKGEFYTWEISGKDANDVLRANDVLAKRLGVAP
jgi:hypothetical protein